MIELLKKIALNSSAGASHILPDLDNVNEHNISNAVI